MTAAKSMDLLSRAVRGDHPIDSHFVDAVATTFGLATPDVRTLVRAALRTAGAPADGYEIRTGGWRLDLPAAVAKAAACSTVTTILLRGLGADSIPATVLSIVAPLLFELERIEVSAEDLIVHAYLTDAASNDVLHLADLYDSLPVDVQSELSVREFAGVVERLREAHILVVGAEGVKLQHLGAARRFKLYLR